MKASVWLLFLAGILLSGLGCLLAAYALGLLYLFSYEGPGNGALPTTMGVLSVAILAAGVFLFRKGWRMRKATAAGPGGA